jgi:hypothetical protein
VEAPGSFPDYRRVGALAVAAALVAAAFANMIGNEAGESGDVVGFFVVGLISAAVAALLFLRVIPAAADTGGERAERTGLITSVLAFLSVAVFWSGLPFVLGPAGVILGRIAAERSERSRGTATAAIVIGVVAVLLAVAVLIGDELDN